MTTARNDIKAEIIKRLTPHLDAKEVAALGEQVQTNLNQLFDEKDRTSYKSKALGIFTQIFNTQCKMVDKALEKSDAKPLEASLQKLLTDYIASEQIPTITQQILVLIHSELTNRDPKALELRLDTIGDNVAEAITDILKKSNPAKPAPLLLKLELSNIINNHIEPHSYSDLFDQNNGIFSLLWKNPQLTKLLATAEDTPEEKEIKRKAALRDEVLRSLSEEVNSLEFKHYVDWVLLTSMGLYSNNQIMFTYYQQKLLAGEVDIRIDTFCKSHQPPLSSDVDFAHIKTMLMCEVSAISMSRLLQINKEISALATAANAKDAKEAPSKTEKHDSAGASASAAAATTQPSGTPANAGMYALRYAAPSAPPLSPPPSPASELKR